MINLVSDTIDKKDIDRLISWLSQEKIPRLTKGELTVELEKKWAEKIGTKYSVFVNSGSSAILLTLAVMKEFNFLKNNKIVVPALSWATDVSSPMLLNFETRLCDCNLYDLSCDLEHLENLFKNFKPAAFILVTPLGLVPNMEQILYLCEKYDVILIEDNCESMGSKYKNKYLGSFGFASLFSTYFGHHLSTIEGGFINTNNEDFYHGLLMMRSHGWDRDLPIDKQKELRNKAGVSNFEALYTFYVPGFNLRSTDLQAFIGIGAIDKLDNFSQIRNKNFLNYQKSITNNELTLVDDPENFISNFAYPIASQNRENIVLKLRENNIECRPLIAGNMANKPFWKKLYGTQDLPNANYIDRRGFYVPNHQDISEQDISLISNIINQEK